MKLMRLIVVTGYLLFSFCDLFSQGIFTGINKKVINLTCTQVCTDLNFQVPHLKSDDDYQLVSIPYTPYEYTTPAGNELFGLYSDDKYSSAIALPFPICFYGAVYNQVVVGSNGLLTFDVANANCDGAYTVTPQIPYSLGTICQQNSTYYPKASIMGAYSDLDPQASASPAGRKIEWQIEGTIPFRRFIASWNKVGVYNNLSCSSRTPTTFQIVINESTSVVEVFFENKTCVDGSTGLAILGVQDWSRTKAVSPPDKNAQVWTAKNEGYRFIPSGASSRFVRSELYVLNGTVPISTATTTTTTQGLLDISFSNICFAAASQQYLVKTIYSSCIDPTIPIVIDDTITVNKLPLPVILAPSPTSCSGASNGAISVNATGVPPYSFSLDGATAVAAPSVPYTFFNIAAGIHTIIAYDASGCESTPTDVNVPAGSVFTTIVTSSDALCYLSANGSITVTQPSTGNPPFQYSLDGINWQANNVFNNLSANTYTVYYKEASGCQGSQTVVITQPAPLTIASAAALPAICNGATNGSVTVIVGGGTTPYQYSIDGINWQPSNTFTLAAGSYTITIKDNKNCLITQSVTITQPPSVTATAITGNATCGGGNDGTISITATGGTGNFTYSIDGTTFQNAAIFNVAPGSYNVTVKDAAGCSFVFAKTVGLTNNLTFTPQTDPTICESKSTQLELISNATQYSWSPAAGLNSTSVYNPVANPRVTTTYNVIATLGNCSTADAVTVHVNKAPVPDAGQNGFICYGQTYTLQGSGGVQYTWTPSTYLNSTNGANPIATPAKTIIYTLSKIVDGNGCESLTTDDMVLDVTPPVKITTLPFDTVGYPGDKFQLQAIAAVPAANIFTWSPPARLSDASIYNPVVTVGNINDDVVYRVTAASSAGCKGEGFVRIRVYKGPDVYVPTGFTPNGDGKNDKFTPFPVGLKSISYFKVFNRWGQQIFSTIRLNDGWDGTMNGVQQPSGTYAWMIQGVTKDDKLITKKGTITLIR